MDVSRTSRVAAVALCLAVLPLLSFAQSGHSNYDPTAQQRSSTPRDGFLDYTLKRLNPSDTDDGQCLGGGRTVLLEETVRNSYFWSNLTALGLLGCLFIIIVFQHRIHTKREWMTAEILRQFEQSLARSRAQVEETTKKNHHLLEVLAALRESAMRSPSLPAESAERSASSAAKPRTSSAQAAAPAPLRTNSGKPANGRAAGTAVATEPVVTAAANPGGQIALFKPEVELVTKVNALEQEIGRSHELEKQLRRQLNETGRKLQAEQEKNRSLKGE